MTWYRVTLTKEQVFEGVWLQLQAAFSERYFRTRLIPLPAAMFSEERYYGGIDLYFSPNSISAMSDYLEKFNGEPCEKPLPTVKPLVGHDAIKLLE